MVKLTDDQAKALHIKDAKKAMVQLQKDKQVPGATGWPPSPPR